MRSSLFEGLLCVNSGYSTTIVVDNHADSNPLIGLFNYKKRAAETVLFQIFRVFLAAANVSKALFSLHHTMQASGSSQTKSSAMI
jgi:elongation factor P hydroxylase